MNFNEINEKNIEERTIEILETTKSKISTKRAIALALTSFALGIPTGAGINSFMKNSKAERKISISEEQDSSINNTTTIKAGDILNVKFPDSLDNSNMIVVGDEQELGCINKSAVNLYDKFEILQDINIRRHPDAKNDDFIMKTIGPDDEIYINMSDTTIYNPNDTYEWKPAIYEKEGIEYDGFVALHNDRISKVLDATSIKAKVNRDTQINFESEKTKVLFNNMKKNEIIRAEDEYIIEPQFYNENPIYSLIEDSMPDRSPVYGYKDVEISDEDIKLISNFTASWENAPLYLYLTGYSNDYNNMYVSSCITEDRKKYICYIDGLGYYGDNSARNYGFGVNISENNEYGYREKNSAHVDIIEKKYGYDMDDKNLLEPWVSLMPVHVIDEAREYYLKDRVEEVKATLKSYDIQFTKGEILALTAISYQCGPERIPNLIENYAKWGNSKALRRNFVLSGANPFEYASGTTVNYKGYNVERYFAYWKAFHDEEFIFTDGSVKTIEKTREVNDGFVR